jgi:hypothetical protein
MFRVFLAGLIMMAAGIGFQAFAQEVENDSASQKPAVQQAAETKSTDEQLTELKGKLDGLDESYLETKGTVDKLSKIKVSGYLQAQYNRADTIGVIAANVQSRFLIKRGRVKTSYENKYAKYVLELDATQDGVGIKDAFVSFKEPWLQTIAATIGAMDRPFGYEVSYSSSMLESPERSKVIGVLFPKEKDIGAMLEIAADEGLFYNVNLKAGVYNGMTNILNENDNNKDFIGRLGFKLPLADAGLDIDGGISMYSGKVTAMDTTGGKGVSYAIDNKVWKSTPASQLHSTYDRQYTGFDVQLYYATPGIGGTCIKGEYTFGKNPGTHAKYDPYGLAAPALTDNVYTREMAGWYAYLIQNVDPIGAQFVLKYDVFDPNTKIDKGDLVDTLSGAATGLNAADVAISTFGVGMIYYLTWDPNVRIMLYYEMPKYEKVSASGVQRGAASPLYYYTTDHKLNQLTLRVQYKF